MTETRSDVVANYLRQSASGFVNVGVVELGGLVCPDGRCAAQTTDGVVIFRDEKHITASFARSLVPLFKDRLEVLGVSPAQPESDMIVR